MKILHDNISTDLGRHLHLLKALDASGRNRMRKWRQRKRDLKAEIAAKLPCIAEVEDEDTCADLAPSAVYVLYGNCRSDGMITIIGWWECCLRRSLRGGISGIGSGIV